MKKLFIHARSKTFIDLPRSLLRMIEKEGRIGILTTIQHLHQQKLIAGLIKGSLPLGQVLGCTKNFRSDVDAYLYVGTGKFHPLNIRDQTGKPVFTFNPQTGAVGRITGKDTRKFLQKKKGALLRFLNSQFIGILVSAKEGQYRMKDAERLKKKLEKKGKNVYIFVSDTLDLGALESFPKIECFVNTACPRLIEDESPRPIINIDDILDI